MKLDFSGKVKYWAVATMVLFLARCFFHEEVRVPELGSYLINVDNVCLKYKPGEVIVDYIVLHDSKAITRTVNHPFPGKCLDDSIFGNDGVYGVYYTIYDERINKEKYFFVRIIKVAGKFDFSREINKKD